MRQFLAWVWLLPIAACVITRAAPAPAVSSGFDQANKLYEQGKYQEAIAAYQRLIQDHNTSAALYFNLGNACFKSAKPGEAIAYYRLAQRLDPRDPDIRANLRFARDSINASSAGPGAWQRWLNLLTLNELTLATAFLVWAWFLLLAASEYRRDWARSLRSARLWTGVATGLAVLWLSAASMAKLSRTAAVVITHEAPVRYGPFEEAQKYFTARDGTEVEILDRKDNWAQISDMSKRVGWIQAKELFVLPPG